MSESIDIPLYDLGGRKVRTMIFPSPPPPSIFMYDYQQGKMEFRVHLMTDGSFIANEVKPK